MTKQRIEALRQLGEVLRKGEELVQVLLLDCENDRLKPEEISQLRYLKDELSEIQKEENENDINSFVTKCLLQLGVESKFNGYHYLRTAIMLGVNDLSELDSITKKLYPHIAEKYNTIPPRVERSIRHAIESSINKKRINRELFYEIFGNSVVLDEGKPTNSAYVAGIVDYVRQTFAIH